MRKYLMTAAVLLLVGCTNEIIDIEAQNEFEWQKYMNEDEFNQINVGMDYLEVVRIVGGAGQEIAPNKYEWPDEQLMIQAYVLTFENDILVEKEMIEKNGHSTR